MNDIYQRITKREWNEFIKKYKGKRIYRLHIVRTWREGETVLRDVDVIEEFHDFLLGDRIRITYDGRPNGPSRINGSLELEEIALLKVEEAI